MKLPTRLRSIAVVVGLLSFLGGLDIAVSTAADLPTIPSAILPTDLDVTYIERTPRYPRNLSCRAGSPPTDYPCPSPLKRGPDAGEIVTFAAHVHGGIAGVLRLFAYVWEVDDVVVKQGFHVSLADADQPESLEWPWQAGPHRVRYTVSSLLDPFSANDSREVRTDAYALSIFVEQGQYDAFNLLVNGVGSMSFEDWINAQFDKINETFAAARFATTPDGVLSSVRIDKIGVAPEMDGAGPTAYHLDPDEFLNDGRWLFSDGDPTNARGTDGFYDEYASSFVGGFDWGLIHELGHQIGRIDMYTLDFNPDHNLITGTDGAPLHIGHQAAYAADIMEDPGSGVWSEYHAASFNRDHGDRAGLFGAYLFDLPVDNRLRFVDGDGAPIPGATVRVYHDQNDYLDDASLVLAGVTDTQGYFSLGANPFGVLDRGGLNATLFLSFTVSGTTEYHWLEATAFNLAFWRGHQAEATYTITAGRPDHQDLTLPPVLGADSTVPSVALVSPVGGAGLTAFADFEAVASDDRGIKRVEIVLDGKPIYVFPRAPFHVYWDTSQVDNGTHQVWARAFDTALPANVTESSKATISVQNARRHLFSWDFEVDDDFDAWDLAPPESASASVAAGSFRLTVSYADPTMRRWLPFGLTTDAGQSVTARMRVSSGGGGDAQFYWTTYADQQEDEVKAHHFTVQGDGEWHEYAISVGTNLAWRDRIRTIRFDPVDGTQYVGATVEIDWIRLVPE